MKLPGPLSEVSEPIHSGFGSAERAWPAVARMRARKTGRAFQRSVSVCRRVGVSAFEKRHHLRRDLSGHFCQVETSPANTPTRRYVFRGLASDQNAMENKRRA